MWVLTALAALAAAPEFEIRTTDGQTAQGALVACSAESLTLATTEGEKTFRTVQAARLQLVGGALAPTGEAKVRVELIDGSSIAVQAASSDGKTATMLLAEGAAVSAPIAVLDAVRLRAPDPAFDDAWESIRAGDRPGDLLVLRKKSALDYVAGELGKLNEDSIEVKIDGDSRSIKLTRIEGLVYLRRGPKKLPEAAFTIVDVAGGRWQVASAELVDGALAVKTPAGVEWKTPLARVAAIEFKLQYLSDLTPEKSSVVPYIDDPAFGETLASLYAPRFDENWRGEKLLLDGVPYAKGLALHSKTDLIYRLPAGKFSRLQALVGIDDSVRPNGACTLEIFGDEKSLIRLDVKGASSPQPIDVPLAGVRKLHIVVDYGDDLDAADCLDLADARLLP